MLERGIVEPAQHQHLAARQQRGVELEGRVLGGGADQRDRAVLDNGQEAVLLGAVEAMDLVDEQQRALPSARRWRAPRRTPCLQVGDAGEHRRQRLEVQADRVGEQPRDGGLAAARRAPQDQRGERPRASIRAERAVGAEQMVLADDLVERAWAAAGRPAASGRERRRARPARPDATTPQRNWMVETSPSRPMLTLDTPAAMRVLRSATLFDGWPLTAVTMSPGRRKRPA